MTNYKYRTMDKTGKKRSGTMQAMDEDDLFTKLKEKGEYLIAAEQVRESKNTKPIKPKQLAEFSRQIGTLVGSGVSLVRALKIVADEETNTPREKEIYETVLMLVRQGMPLSQALDEQEGVFPQLLINMYKSAEVSGNLDKTALRLADHYEKDYKLNSKVKSAMTYPKILGFLIVGVVIIIMSYVVPQFQSMFDDMETLPMATTILLAISDFVKVNWIGIIIAVVIFSLVMMLVFRIPAIHLWKDRVLLHMPVLGKQQKIVCTARFARTLSSMYSAGIPIVTSLQIARGTVGNFYIEQQFDEVIFTVRTGGNLSDALAQVDGFTNKLSASIRIGEETGNLDYMLTSIADSMDYESEIAVEKMVSYLEPVMIIVMAAIVGFIIIAVIKPIYGSYETIGQSSY